jgi:hypothetical protein
MNQNEFVDSLRNEARDAAASDVLDLVKKPPGRRPSANLLELSKWYHSLNDTEKNCLEAFAKLVSHHAVFGVLAILDRVRAIEGMGEGDRLELRFVHGNEVTFLTTQNGPMLHDLL